MDLEELKEDLQIQLTEIQNQIAELKSSSQSSKSSNELKSLKEFVFKMQDALQKSNSENLKKIVTDYNEQIKTITQSVVDDTVKAIRRNSETLNEETKKFNEELKAVKKTHFSFLANAFMYIFLGIILTFVGTVGFNFFKIQDGFYKELAENKKLESIEKKAVAKYKKEILADQEHKELTKLVESWKKKNGTK